MKAIDVAVGFILGWCVLVAFKSFADGIKEHTVPLWQLDGTETTLVIEGDLEDLAGVDILVCREVKIEDSLCLSVSERTERLRSPLFSAFLLVKTDENYS